VSVFRTGADLQEMPDIGQLGWAMSGWRFLFWMDEKDLTWLFSLHPHAPLNSTTFIYSRNMGNNFFNLSLHKIDCCHFSSF
jgi:hypothetical protein